MTEGHWEVEKQANGEWHLWSSLNDGASAIAMGTSLARFNSHVRAVFVTPDGRIIHEYRWHSPGLELPEIELSKVNCKEPSLSWVEDGF